MKRFAALYRALEATTSSSGKQSALQDYLRGAPPADAAWAVYLLSGGTPRKPVPSKLARELSQERSGYPEWMFEECHQAVGDLAETIALLLPPPSAPQERPLADWIQELIAFRETPKDQLPEKIKAQWDTVPTEQRLVYFKLMMGAFRVGVSRIQVTNALSGISGVDPKLIAQRLMGMLGIDVQPTATDFEKLVAKATDGDSGEPGGKAEDLRPYPFFLAHPVPRDQEIGSVLGAPEQWQGEWKWDGIRAQCIRRKDGVAIWSRGEELITDRFPEIAELFMTLPEGTVIDGELVIIERDGERWTVRPFSDLQKRIGRKVVSAKIRKELPAFLIAFDVLELAGIDLREKPLRERRPLLETVCARYASPAWEVSPLILGTSWEEVAISRNSARELNSEGLMLKHLDSKYGVGRTKADGVWWKWKLDPLSVDAVLVYAQKGAGRRANLYSDYTFAVWNKQSDPPELVTFAKAYSGLSDEEMKEVDAIIRKTTKETFGPVRSVEPSLVFEIGFEGIAKSARHKSGIATRFPRMLKWRHDKRPEDADTLETLQKLVER